MGQVLSLEEATARKKCVHQTFAQPVGWPCSESRDGPGMGHLVRANHPKQRHQRLPNAWIAQGLHSAHWVTGPSLVSMSKKERITNGTVALNHFHMLANYRWVLQQKERIDWLFRKPLEWSIKQYIQYSWIGLGKIDGPRRTGVKLQIFF